ncbi:MAG: HAD-IA family hydrolase [Clostridiales bacterium]|nr:HAD-IA family hydrolase [Clostridiales bacterium]
MEKNIKAVIFDMFETLVTLNEGPVYFGTQIASDLNINRDKFRSIWDKSDEDRTNGKRTLEDVIAAIMRANDVYSPELLDMVIKKRTDTKRACFQRIPDEIFVMLNSLKEKGIRIGLISNCFSEEVTVIKESRLYDLFDAPCLSFELGIKKPDPRIFEECMRRLDVTPGECLYIGDGGSRELEAARQIGMKAYQAAWFIVKDPEQFPVNDSFEQLYKPSDVIGLI